MLIRLGGLVSQGLLDLGGRNCVLKLVSRNGLNRMASIVGIALFTQYYYWFPMFHFINLAVEPTLYIGLDQNLKVVKNYKLLSKSKPSVFGYPKEVKTEEKTEKEKVAAPILSSQTRALNKKKSRLGTSNSMNTDMQIENLEKNVSRHDTKPIIEEDEGVVNGKKEEKEKPVPEPEEETLSNPCRILPKQQAVIQMIEGQDYYPIVNRRQLNGYVLLKAMNDNVVPEYFEEVPLIEAPKEESKDNKEGKDGYQKVNADEAEMPEDIEIDDITKK